MKRLFICLALVLTSFTFSAQMKLAHVNSQRLLDSLPSYAKAKADLKKFQDDGVNELGVLEKQINDAYVKLDGLKDDLTPTMLKIEQEKIMGMEQRYQQTQSLLQQQRARQQLSRPVQTMLRQEPGQGLSWLKVFLLGMSQTVRQ